MISTYQFVLGHIIKGESQDSSMSLYDLSLGVGLVNAYYVNYVAGLAMEGLLGGGNLEESLEAKNVDSGPASEWQLHRFLVASPTLQNSPRMTDVNQRLMFSRDRTLDWKLQGRDLKLENWNPGFEEVAHG